MEVKICVFRILNPFVPNAPFLYSLKTSENRRFPGVFRRQRKSALGANGSNNTYICFIFFANMLVYNLLFFFVFTLSLHLDDFIRFFHFLIPVTVQQGRVEIGTFNCRYILRYHQSCNFFTKDKTVIVGFDFAFLLLSHGDIEVNPRSKNCSTSFSFCQWNLKSLTAHIYVKSSSLQA